VRHTSVRRHIKPDYATLMMPRAVHAAAARAVSHAAALKLAAHYRQLPDKTSKEYLIICSPDIKHIRQFQVISNVYTKKQQVIL
jgi:hypothetical protein